MNAYELADELLRDNTQLTVKAAYMLRQQADRIAELEKDGKVCATCGGLVYDPVIKQTNPLSDEEIEKVFDNTFKVRDFEEAFLKFARAIEERHGIK